MNFSAASLEFDRLKDLLGRYVATDAASRGLAVIAPFTDRAALEREHALTAEAMAYLAEHRVPFNNILLLDEVFAKLAVAGSTLEIVEIEAIQQFLAQIEGLRGRWKAERETFPLLAAKSALLPDLRDLASHLGRAIQNGQVDDRYSPELARIRRSLAAARARVTEKLEAMVRDPDQAARLQDQLVTIRNGRFVIPVRVEQKRAVVGIVHASSSSGATVFVEPLAAIEWNNEIVRLEERERNEVARILAELSERILASASLLRLASRVAAELEVTFAKARFGRDFDCARPSFSEQPALRLVKARHPLLEDNLRSDGRAIHPVSLDLSAARRILVISGPNAGGKTVVLKTAGLLALMAQAGIPVPAESAVFSLFDCALADIGDRQSITNHLSTFSAHVLALKSMLESATPQSLILLDEIGSSTEPGEGAALAIAVLEQLRQIGTNGPIAIATTHYNRLKMYAESTAGIANAAMEFNAATLDPTYRILHGLAGASSGLSIAERLGMPQPVIVAARALVDRTETEANRYVEELRRRAGELEAREAQIARERAALDRDKQTEIDRLRARHKEEIAATERRLDGIVKEMAARAARELEHLQDDTLKKKYRQKLDVIRSQAAADTRREKQTAPWPQDAAARPVADAPTARSTPPLAVGMTVRVHSLGLTGKVTRLGTGEAEVLAGALRMWRPVDDLEGAAPKSITLPTGVRLNAAPREPASSEINLLGSTVEEAVSRVDKFLDDAFIAELPLVRIVHGSGTGALRNAVTTLLRTHPHIAHFEFASQAEGGRGVTVATLRE